MLPPRDTAAALRVLTGAREHRERLGRRSRRLGCRWSLDEMVRSYEAVLVEALEEACQRAGPRRGRTGPAPDGPDGRRSLLE